MSKTEFMFSDVKIAVVGFINGKSHEIVLTEERRELVKCFLQSLYKKGEPVRLSGIELPLEINAVELVRCES